MSGLNFVYSMFFRIAQDLKRKAAENSVKKDSPHD